MEIIVLVLVAFFGAVVQGMVGMGYSMLCMAILPFVLPFYDLAICMKLLSLVFCAPLFGKLRTKINWKVLAMPTLVSFVGATLGYQVLIRADEILLQRLLGVLLLGISIFFLVRREAVRIRPNMVNGSITGLASGFCSGACNVPGPPLAIYYMNVFPKDKEMYFATISATFLINGAYQIGLYIIDGNITAGGVQLAAIAAVPTIIGYFVGRKLFDRISTETVQRAVYASVCIMSLSLIVFSV